MSFDGSATSPSVSNSGRGSTGSSEGSSSGVTLDPQVGYITDVLDAVAASTVFKQVPIFLVLPPASYPGPAGPPGPQGVPGPAGRPGDLVMAPPVPCAKACCRDVGVKVLETNDVNMAVTNATSVVTPKQ